MMWEHGWSWAQMFGGNFVMMLFWALVIELIVLAIRSFTSNGGTNQAITADGRDARKETPLDRLKMRYANGEIGEDEYDLMKQRLI